MPPEASRSRFRRNVEVLRTEIRFAGVVSPGDLPFGVGDAQSFPGYAWAVPGMRMIAPFSGI